MDWWSVLRGAELLYGGLLLLLGGIAGSFASAAIYRIPAEDLSLIRPARSFCPSCKHTLSWFDNLPFFGWILLRGRCRYCGVTFGAAYLIHEIGLAVLFYHAGYSWAGEQGPLALGLFLITLTALWIAATIDFKHFILPDGITLGGIVFGIAVAFLEPSFQMGLGTSELPWGVSWLGLTLENTPQKVAFASSFLGAGISFLLLFGIRTLFRYILGQEALGLGDVKYLTAVGALLGLEGAIWTFFVGVLVGAIFGLLNIVRMICLIASRRRRRKQWANWRLTVFRGWWLGRVIPFGPPLILGTGLVLFAQDSLRTFFLQTWPRLIQDFLT